MSGAWTRLHGALTELVTRRTVHLLVIGVFVTGLAAAGLSRPDANRRRHAHLQQLEDHQTNQRYQREFGGENVLILLTGDHSDILSPGNPNPFNQWNEDCKNFPASAP